MAANIRVFLNPENYYHFYNHANGHENLFRCQENYRYFLKRYGEFIEPVAITHAYCLMANHIHFLIRIRSREEIENNVGTVTFQKYETFGKFLKQITMLKQTITISNPFHLSTTNKQLVLKNKQKAGFTMMQYSVYTWHSASKESMEVHVKCVKGFIPAKGQVSILKLIDKQCGDIINIWEKKSDLLPGAPPQPELF